MQSLLEANCAVGVVEGLLDDNLTVTYASRLFYKHLGYGTDDVKRFNGHSFLDIVHPDDLEEFKCKLFSSLTDLRHDFHFDATYRAHVRGNGSVRSAPSATRTAAATGRSAMPWACSSTLTKVSGKRKLRACSTRTGGSGSFSSVDVTALWA